jgi:hypothetical protein
MSLLLNYYTCYERAWKTRVLCVPQAEIAAASHCCVGLLLPIPYFRGLDAISVSVVTDWMAVVRRSLNRWSIFLICISLCISFCFVCLICDLVIVATPANTFHTTILISYMEQCEILNRSVKFQTTDCEIMLPNGSKTRSKWIDFLNPD